MSATANTQGTAQSETLEKKLAETGLDDDKSANIPSTESSSAGTSVKENRQVIKTPFTEPVPSAKPAVRPNLTTEQQKKYDTILETVKSWEKVPSTTGKAGPLEDDEIMWLTQECLLRYLRATKWSTTEAAKRILGTLSWRRDYGVNSLTAEHISPENETGKQLILGFDIAARPCLYLNPGRQNTDPSPRQVQHLVYMLERVIDLSPVDQEQLALLINFKSSKNRSNTSPPLSQGKEVLNILQTHYPERLGRCCLINIPWLVSGFLKLILPFVDPVTREKLKFNDNVRSYVPPEQLSSEMHGDVEFEYDHSVYWPALTKLCEQKRHEQKIRWEKAGKRYGESESYIKGGVPVPGPEAIESKQQVQEKDSGSIPSTAAQPEVQSPVQNSGSQANGNTDIAALQEDPKLTREGDRP